MTAPTTAAQQTGELAPRKRANKPDDSLRGGAHHTRRATQISPARSALHPTYLAHTDAHTDAHTEIGPRPKKTVHTPSSDPTHTNPGTHPGTDTDSTLHPSHFAHTEIGPRPLKNQEKPSRPHPDHSPPEKTRHISKSSPASSSPLPEEVETCTGPNNEVFCAALPGTDNSQEKIGSHTTDTDPQACPRFDTNLHATGSLPFQSAPEEAASFSPEDNTPARKNPQDLPYAPIPEDPFPFSSAPTRNGPIQPDTTRPDDPARPDPAHLDPTHLDPARPDPAHLRKNHTRGHTPEGGGWGDNHFGYLPSGMPAPATPDTTPDTTPDSRTGRETLPVEHAENVQATPENSHRTPSARDTVHTAAAPGEKHVPEDLSTPAFQWENTLYNDAYNDNSEEIPRERSLCETFFPTSEKTAKPKFSVRYKDPRFRHLMFFLCVAALLLTGFLGIQFLEKPQKISLQNPQAPSSKTKPGDVPTPEALENAGEQAKNLLPDVGDANAGEEEGLSRFDQTTAIAALFLQSYLTRLPGDTPEIIQERARAFATPGLLEQLLLRRIPPGVEQQTHVLQVDDFTIGEVYNDTEVDLVATWTLFMHDPKNGKKTVRGESQLRVSWVQDDWRVSSMT